VTPARRRLDSELVRRGLVVNRQAAQAAVADGRVLVGGSLAERSSRLVSPSEPLELVGEGPRFVSRGGEKLDAALDRFGIEVGGRVALDAGASTGGFTDCLLQRGAALVLAVDVGHGQLDASLRRDERVIVVERTNVRTLTLDARWAGTGRAPAAVDVVTADLSFISLRTVLPVLAGTVAGDGADLVLLVKPQFEAGRREATRGKGVIRDPAVWAAALEGVASSLSACGAAIMGVMRSPITGASGNVEFLLHAVARPSPGTLQAGDVPELVHAAVSEQDR
jgi:23S rRNA (cytidine1920-2'-O)/16S rRNA (cytidine1409-2'-O)-methyltransferase